mmetsp:Transcript_27451/g.45760  ORF Transcript_27451/g.45760 Transcript_27451/m.45760 type:complete len:164 (-) Transcript_27451:181-672(-)
MTRCGGSSFVVGFLVGLFSITALLFSLMSPTTSHVHLDTISDQPGNAGALEFDMTKSYVTPLKQRIESAPAAALPARTLVRTPPFSSLSVALRNFELLSKTTHLPGHDIPGAVQPGNVTPAQCAAECRREPRRATPECHTYSRGASLSPGSLIPCGARSQSAT